MTPDTVAFCNAVGPMTPEEWRERDREDELADLAFEPISAEAPWWVVAEEEA